MTETGTTASNAKRWGARSIVSLILFVLAAVLVIPATVGHWGHRTVLDSERYLDTVGPLIYQPEVQQALTDAATRQVIERVDTEAQVSDLLNNIAPNLGFTDQLAGPIAAGINSLIGELVGRFIASDQFAQAWIVFNEAAQRGVVLVLEGKEGGPIYLKGDDIVLDTSAALVAIQNYLVENGVTAAGNITVPETDREIVLATTPALAQIRFIYSLTSPILEFFPALVALLFGIAIMLARRRARTVVATGIVLLVGDLLVIFALNSAQTTFENELAGTPWGPAADIFWNTLLNYLIAGIQALIALGIVLIVAGWFGGRTAIATQARGQVRKGLDEIGGRFSDRRPGVIPASALPVVHIVIYVVTTAILLFSGLLAVSTVLWVSALAAGLVTLAQILAVPKEESTSSNPPELSSTV